MSLIEAARTMLADAKLPITFWAEAVNTACYVQNKVLVDKAQNKTPYELFNGITSAIRFLKPFGCHVMILNTLDNLSKFEAKGDEGTKVDARKDVKKDVSSLRYIILPNWIHEEHLESTLSQPQDACNTDSPESSGNSNSTVTSTNPPADQLDTLTVETPIPIVSSPVPTVCFTDSQVKQDLFQRGGKWVLKNKKDKRGIVIRNKARLVAQGHTQEEGIDYDEVFAPVARIKAIRLFLAYASFMGFTVYQMYVKSAFFYGTINEEVYMMQPPGFQDPVYPARVYKVEKAMYGLHQAPRAWYGTLSKYLLTNGFQRGTIDQTLFIRRQRGDLILVQVYVDDIIFGSTNLQLCREFEALMHEKFQMSAMGELNFFLGLQVLQKEDGIFFSQDKYVGITSRNLDIQMLDLQILLWTRRILKERMVLEKMLSMSYETLSKEISTSILRLLQFCDYHNMVAILEKSEHNVDFHPIVDFVEASPLRIETTKKETQILATVDGVLRTVTESSLRRNLKLQDEEGISSLPDTELFENLTLMGYNISPNQKFTFQKDEPASPIRDDSQGEACPIDSGFIADQDRATIAKSFTLPHDSIPRVTSPAAEEGTQEVEINRLEERVKTLEDNQGVIGARFGDDASIKGKRIDEEEVAIKRLSSDTKEVRLDEGEVAAERTSDDTEEMANVLTTMDAAIVLASGVAEVPTGSGSIPTAGAEVPTGSNVVPTTSPVFATATMVTPYRRRKGKEVMVESETPKKQKVQEQIDAQIAKELKEQLAREDQKRAEQIARDAKIARIYAEEELQSMIESFDSNNETVAKYLEEYRQFSSELLMERKIELITDLVKYQDNYSKVYIFQSQQRKSWTKKQKRDYYMAVIKNNLGWKEVHTEGQRAYWKITRLGGSSASYQFFTDILKHLDREDLNQLWTLNLMHAPVEWKLYDSCGVHHVAAKGNEIFMLVEKDYPLTKGLALMMTSYKLQVENYSQMAEDLIRKIYNIVKFSKIKVPTAIRNFPLPEEECYCQKKRDVTVSRLHC
nr:retrovirus-related Pol polyprotein from transposon TNT 1-94 [Tanacetum cinerariifolium]